MRCLNGFHPSEIPIPTPEIAVGSDVFGRGLLCILRFTARGYIAVGAVHHNPDAHPNVVFPGARRWTAD